jgi:hypothetical protein
MFLLHTQAQHHNRVQLFPDFMTAWNAALEFVGLHNPVDGCSTEPVTRHLDEMGSWVARSTSFGYRRAAVVPVSTEISSTLI